MKTFIVDNDPNSRALAISAITRDIQARNNETHESIESIIAASVVMTVKVSTEAGASLSTCIDAVEDFLAAYRSIITGSGSQPVRDGAFHATVGCMN
jgi:hypothetical protein